MKILITGAAGMLADEIITMLIKEGHDVIQTDINQRLPDIGQLDVSDNKEVYKQINSYKPDYVFHLAAETNVDLCEENPDHAYKINTLGTENIVLGCQKSEVPLLYISTAGVFPGDKQQPYTEFDIPKPINVYGDSKWQGEIIVRNLLSNYFIIRAGWMVGGWEIDKKFVYKIIQQLASGKKEIKVVNDKFGSPTFTKDFAQNLMNVINTQRYGTYHMANKGTCSRYDIAVKIVEFMGLEKDVQVVQISSDEFPLPAPRANSEMMRNYKLDLLSINHMPEWESSLKSYISSNRDNIENECSK